jgi:hypothetical protein
MTSNTSIDFLFSRDDSDVAYKGLTSKNQNQEEDSQVVCSSPIAERLRMLLRIVERVDNPHWQISPEELASILFDLGSLLCNSEWQTSLGEDVKEVPHLKDTLGNVLMLHSSQRENLPLENLIEVGNSLMELGHNVLTQKRIRPRELSLKDESFLDDDELVQLDKLISARRLLQQTKRDLYQCERRNERLHGQVGRLQEKLKRMESRTQAPDFLGHENLASNSSHRSKVEKFRDANSILSKSKFVDNVLYKDNNPRKWLESLDTVISFGEEQKDVEK